MATATVEDLRRDAQAAADADAEAKNANGNGGTHPDGLEEPEEQEEGNELIIEGTGQLSMAVGGKSASGSSLRIVGGKFSVNGQYRKGERIRVSFDLVVSEVAFVDEHDPKTRQVISCERRHKARVVSPPVVERQGD